MYPFYVTFLYIHNIITQFRSYESLRREHDSQIIRMAMEAGLRISPEQWSTLLYGDHKHKSDMQSIIDKVRDYYI